MAPWYTQIWNAVLNEPFTVIGFLGVAFAWWRRNKVQESESEAEARQRGDDRKLEISDVVQDALYLLDRVEHKTQSIFRYEDGYFEATSTFLEDDQAEMRTRLRSRIDELREQLNKFDINDSSHGNLLVAKKLLSSAKRLDAVGTDKLEAIRRQHPSHPI